MAIENFGQSPEAVRADVVSKRLKIGESCGAVAVGAEMRECERSEQPSPNRPLVISSIARALIAAIVALIAGFAGRKTTEAIAREQVLRADVNDGFLLVFQKRTDGQGDR